MFTFHDSRRFGSVFLCGSSTSLSLTRTRFCRTRTYYVCTIAVIMHAVFSTGCHPAGVIKRLVKPVKPAPTTGGGECLQDKLTPSGPRTASCIFQKDEDTIGAEILNICIHRCNHPDACNCWAVGHYALDRPKLLHDS